MSTTDAQQSVSVDPERMVQVYRDKLTNANHEAIMLQSALNGVVDERNALQQKLNDRDAEVARLTAIPNETAQQNPVDPASVWGSSGQGYNPEG